MFREETSLRSLHGLLLKKNVSASRVCSPDTLDFFRVIRRVWRIIKTLRFENSDEMAEFVFDVARCSNGVGNLLSQ